MEFNHLGGLNKVGHKNKNNILDMLILTYIRLILINIFFIQTLIITIGHVNNLIDLLCPPHIHIQNSFLITMFPHFK